MSDFRIDVSGATERAEKILADIPGGAEKAIRSAMSRAVSRLRSQSSTVVREKYDISSADLRANQNVRVSWSGDNTEARVIFSGHKIPLYRYGGASPKQPAVKTTEWVNALVAGKWKRVHPGVAASGHQFKSSPTTKFGNAFVAQMKSGHVGIFERTGGANSRGDSIKEIMGSSVAQMLGNEEVAQKLIADANETLSTRLEHEITRILNGY